VRGKYRSKGAFLCRCVCVCVCIRVRVLALAHEFPRSTRRRKAAGNRTTAEEEDRNRGGNVAGKEDASQGRRDARELGREQIDVSGLMYHARYLASEGRARLIEGVGALLPWNSAREISPRDNPPCRPRRTLSCHESCRSPFLINPECQWRRLSPCLTLRVLRSP